MAAEVCERAQLHQLAEQGERDDGGGRLEIHCHPAVHGNEAGNRSGASVATTL
jgi:hypothetical protein